MKVYIVLEEDRGCGVSVDGVFSTLAAAKDYLSGRSNCYLYSDDGHEIEDIGRKSYFFTYNQNNSGGVFDRDDYLAEYVIIEAYNAKMANGIAESIGIYFNGVDDGADCSCCGDRWYSFWEEEEGTETPQIYDKSPKDFIPVIGSKNNYCVIHYLDGKIERF